MSSGLLNTHSKSAAWNPHGFKAPIVFFPPFPVPHSSYLGSACSFEGAQWGCCLIRALVVIPVFDILITPEIAHRKTGQQEGTLMLGEAEALEAGPSHYISCCRDSCKQTSAALAGWGEVALFYLTHCMCSLYTYTVLPRAVAKQHGLRRHSLFGLKFTVFSTWCTLDMGSFLCEASPVCRLQWLSHSSISFFPPPLSLENITAITILWGGIMKCKLAYRLVLGGREARCAKIFLIM